MTTSSIGFDVAPGASVGRTHFGSTPPVQVQPVPEAETIDMPVGSSSVTVTSSATDGPSLCAVIENVVWPPASTGLGPVTVLSTWISTSSTIAVWSVSVLFVRSESEPSGGPLTATRLSNVAGPASGATATVRSKDRA